MAINLFKIPGIQKDTLQNFGILSPLKIMTFMWKCLVVQALILTPFWCAAIKGNTFLSNLSQLSTINTESHRLHLLLKPIVKKARESPEHADHALP